RHEDGRLPDGIRIARRRQVRRVRLLLLATIAARLCVDPRLASAANEDAFLFGDWGGARTRLADAGTTFDFGYVSEVAHNFSGGDDELTRYTDQWKLGATFDLEKLMHWSGGSFQIYVTDRNGRNLGADANIGNNQLIQEVYGRGQTWHLTVFALDQKWL